MKKLLISIFIITAFTNTSYSQKILWEEVFDSISITSRGWTIINNDSSSGEPGFFRPFRFVNSGVQNSQQGNYFFKFDFDNANNKNFADDWIITPKLLNIQSGDSISFWCGAIDKKFKDSLKVWISTTDNILSSFRLIDNFKVDGPVGAWHKKIYDLSKYSGKDIFFAVNYNIVNGGPLGSSSDNVWLDHFILTGKGLENSEPTSFVLEQNFPNPFNPETEISFSVPGNSNVTIKIYDISGKEILTLINGFYAKGKYRIVINASDLSSGVYFYKMVSENFSDTKKMELIK